VDLHKVGAHFAVSSLFEEYGEHARVYCYNVDVEDYQRQAAGTAQLAFGRARMESVITHEVDTVSFGVLHFGDHNINAGVRSFRGDERYQEMKDEAFGAFSRADLPEAIRLLDRQFGELTYSLRSLFKDEQRRVLDSILRGSVEEAEGAYRGIFEHHAPLMRFLMDINFPQPSPFKAAAELILNANVRRLLSEAPVDAQRLAELLQEATVWKVPLDEGVLAFTLEQTLHRLARRLEQQPEDMENLRALASAAAAGKALPFTVNLAQAQNHYWQVLQTQYPSRRTLSNRGDDHAAEWLDHFRRLGVDLDVRIE